MQSVLFTYLKRGASAICVHAFDLFTRPMGPGHSSSLCESPLPRGRQACVAHQRFAQHALDVSGVSGTAFDSFVGRGFTFRRLAEAVSSNGTQPLRTFEPYTEGIGAHSLLLGLLHAVGSTLCKAFCSQGFTGFVACKPPVSESACRTLGLPLYLPRIARSSHEMGTSHLYRAACSHRLEYAFVHVLRHPAFSRRRIFSL